MASTKNFLFGLIDTATLVVSGLIDAFNSNFQAIDAMPLPVESGSNSQLSYQKYADGTVHVWGQVDYGQSYPCTQQWAAAAGYASAHVQVQLPVEMADTAYTLIPHVVADKNPDMWWVSQSQATTYFGGSFLCAINDQQASTGVNNKRLNVEIWGRWK